MIINKSTIAWYHY